MTTDAKIRGYSLKRQVDFIRSSHFDEAARKRAQRTGRHGVPFSEMRQLFETSSK